MEAAKEGISAATLLSKHLFVLQLLKNELRSRIHQKKKLFPALMEVTGEINELQVSVINRNLGPFFLFRLRVAQSALIRALFTHETGITQHVGNRSRPPMAIKDPMTYL